MNLNKIGWNESFQQAFNTMAKKDAVPARVLRVNKGEYVLLHETGECKAKISGHMKYHAQTPSDYPSVGDWVAVKLINNHDQGIIYHTLPRKTSFVRKAPISGGRKVKDVMGREMTFGGRTEEQVVAANIDTVFIVVAADKTFNIRRLERYLLVATESGAQPVIIVNKIDKCTDIITLNTSIESIAKEVPVHCVSALERESVEQLKLYIKSGETIGLFGASGVGKSTLINAMANISTLQTGAIRATDDKGRHTTTWRELIVLSEGGILMDTPGMRELQLWCTKDVLEDLFEDVKTLASQCRFRDCTHNTEPGCAIKKALSEGTLDAKRYEHYLFMNMELDYLHQRRKTASSKR